MQDQESIPSLVVKNGSYVKELLNPLYYLRKAELFVPKVEESSQNLNFLPLQTHTQVYLRVLGGREKIGY